MVIGSVDVSKQRYRQHSAGSEASEHSEAIGKSRVGNTSKIHLAVDAHGLPLALEITENDINDCTVAPSRLHSYRLPRRSRWIGSISKAALSLDTMQSNVTQRIKRLESELGVP
ncbi:LysR family transcriptional regulator [Pseudomonas helleri]|uniref:LysR family transcriptional regulator n=1 Tax=Pseudomonas helleri TaxID=1608996 RepID=A0A7X1W6K7_9PSED|nr:LysR family transcriptional regulator [Pseudomonas helleri]MQT57296.1 LysR family transcriptional regulator [Pseudomonas sp. FSL R10-0399]MQT88244.1 LysR family transcriptional regulator [Pseudomonas helleri]